MFRTINFRKAYLNYYNFHYTITLIQFSLTFCWPYISVYLSQYLTNLMYKICFTISFISCLYIFRTHVLIIRRSKLHYTASGIITLIGGRSATYCKTNLCASSWLITEINKLIQLSPVLIFVHRSVGLIATYIVGWCGFTASKRCKAWRISTVYES